MKGLDVIIDGEATRTERLRFALHMAMCDPCERYYHQYAAVRDAAGTLDDELPEDFNDVMGRLIKRVFEQPEAAPES
jgi:anti-sigma factor RsiW